MNRGSSAHRCGAPRPAASFNEAPIHESGKCNALGIGMCTHVASMRPPIHESGKSFGTLTGIPLGTHASMRPRFMNRGSVNNSLQHTDAETLQ